jgi:hypothetical protein
MKWNVMRAGSPRGLLAAAALVASAFAAFAQATNAMPALATSDAPFDPAKAPTLPAEARAAVSSALAKLKSGELIGLVVVASPDGKAWALNVAPKSAHTADPGDIARQALEVCEYQAGRPCAVLSVNGYRARRPEEGGAADLPAMLSNRPSDFDPDALPFLSPSTRLEAAAYLNVSGPRAFAVTTGGLWLWRAGPTVVQAIEKTMADCAVAFKPDTCILYAVNSRVVFGAP